MGARETLNGRKNIARRKLQNGDNVLPDNVLPDQFETVASVLPFDWCPPNTGFDS